VRIGGGEVGAQANGKSVMPDGLGNQMSPQDLADLIAYLQTLR